MKKVFLFFGVVFLTACSESVESISVPDTNLQEVHAKKLSSEILTTYRTVILSDK